MQSKIVRCVGITKTFTGKTDVEALRDITFNIGEHQFVTIVGPSGCGKTTLLKIVAGLIEPTSGQIAFSERHSDRPPTAMVFQSQGLFPWMTTLDNIAFGLEMQGIGRHARRDQAGAFLEKVGLTGFEDHNPHELSGGMRQRVALARAFVTDPQILLMDEPFGALDAQIRLIMQDELLRIWRQDQKTVLFITHDIEEAVRLSDRIIVMSGRPGVIMADLDVPLPRPRKLSMIEAPEAAKLKWEIWGMLEDEVRKSLEPKLETR